MCWILICSSVSVSIITWSNIGQFFKILDIFEKPAERAVENCPRWKSLVDYRSRNCQMKSIMSFAGHPVPCVLFCFGCDKLVPYVRDNECLHCLYYEYYAWNILCCQIHNDWLKTSVNPNRYGGIILLALKYTFNVFLKKEWVWFCWYRFFWFGLVQILGWYRLL